jgi:hypothetical protein
MKIFCNKHQQFYEQSLGCHYCPAVSILPAAKPLKVVSVYSWVKFDPNHLLQMKTDAINVIASMGIKTPVSCHALISADAFQDLLSVDVFIEKIWNPNTTLLSYHHQGRAFDMDLYSDIDTAQRFITPGYAYVYALADDIIVLPFADTTATEQYMKHDTLLTVVWRRQ